MPEIPDKMEDDILIFESVLKSRRFANSESWTNPNELNKKTIDKARVIETS